MALYPLIPDWLMLSQDLPDRTPSCVSSFVMHMARGEGDIHCHVHHPPGVLPLIDSQLSDRTTLIPPDC
ncbi:hypothetical protein E2C01_004393 [Portunus trituberculatus]|uniref:Uncharacterized protein n=1 Tax=Portunus trituberculatus TaxID=210409 RepID=A0A5B7CQF1_PORTR|nr:hypothetical protein [Portunus trituberculatus]